MQFENEFDDNFRKVQSKSNFEIFYHDLRVPDKMISGRPFMFLKRRKEDDGYTWGDRDYFTFLIDIFKQKS